MLARFSIEAGEAKAVAASTAAMANVFIVAVCMLMISKVECREKEKIVVNR
jgi:hypothetical protein